MGVAKDFEQCNKIIKVPKTQEPPNNGLGTILFERMKENKDIIAQIDGLTGKKETYKSLLQRSIRVAISMRQRGLTSEDIVSVCSINHLDVFVPYIASLFIGCKLANLDPTLTLSDAVHLMKQVQPKMIFVGLEGLKLMEDAVLEIKLDTKLVVFGDSDKHEKFSDFLVESIEEENFKPVEVKNVKDTAIIFFSSGTTGLPKGICLSHYALMNQTCQAITFIKGKQIILGFSSLYWCSASIFLLTSVLAQTSQIIFPTFNPEVVWEAIEKYKVTVLCMAASRMLTTCKNGPPNGKDVSSVKLIVITGTTMSEKQTAVVKQMVPGALVANTYGLTETCGSALSFRPGSNPEHISLMQSKANSCGKVAPGFSIKLVNPDTEELLGPYQNGELRLKTDFQMNGYYNVDSSSCWDSEGWLKTGDVAYYDDDHCFYIVDRIKEIFKYQCYHIVPTRLEEVLLSHPAVKAALVVPLPHEEDGNHPVGVVELYKNSEDVSAKQLEMYVEEKVDDRQRLRGGVKIVDQIPITPSGKLRRRDVVKMVKERMI